jgi:hypothetical protein
MVSYTKRIKYNKNKKSKNTESKSNESNELIFYKEFKTSALSRIFNKIESFDNLQILHFEDCMIKDKGAIFIGNYLIQNICLRELTIINDSIGISGLESIGYGLQNNNYLEYFNFKNSTIENINPIITGLMTNNTLQTLILSSLYVYNYTFLLLTELFKINQSIINLDISDTTYPEFLFYGREIFIYNILKLNTALEKLNISSNSIDDNFVLILSNTLSFNKTLRIINLSNNNITNEGYNSMLNNIKNNKTLVEINLNLNLIDLSSSSSISELDTFLQQNYNRNKFWKYPQNLAIFNNICCKNIICAILCTHYYHINIPIEIWIYICNFFYR